jgi:hypothetical protein
MSAAAASTKKPAPAPSAPRSSSPLLEIALGAAWLLGLSAVLLIVEAVIGKSMVGVAVAGAVIVDLAAGWAGVRWDLGAPSPFPVAARRVGMGLALATAVVSLGLLVSLAAGWAHVGLGRPSLTLALAVLRAGALGVRDELLFRGIPLVACERARVPAQHARLFAALAGAAPLLLVPEASPASILLAVSLGFLFATLWQRERSGYAAAAAHAGTLLILRALIHGELLDLDWSTGALAVGARASGPPALVVAAAALAAAFLLPKIPGFRAPPAPPAPRPDEPA